MPQKIKDSCLDSAPFLVVHVCFQASALQACKSEDCSKSYVEKPAGKQPAFQIHIDEPDGACSKIQVSAKQATVDASPLTLNPRVTRLRQPLATIDLPMELSFGGLNGNVVF